ncbi:MAG: single-stranded DNA-binding protein, partial [Ezakiella sp.]
MNNVVLIGRLTRDPELRYLPNTNTANCTFTLAVDKGLSKDKKQEYEQKGWATADFINIAVWGKMAEVVNNFVGKGNLIAINGRLSVRNYEDKQGNKRTWTEVVASNVDFIEWKDRDQSHSSGNSGFNA